MRRFMMTGLRGGAAEVFRTWFDVARVQRLLNKLARSEISINEGGAEYFDLAILRRRAPTVRRNLSAKKSR
jgi:hypothetical protein